MASRVWLRSAGGRIVLAALATIAVAELAVLVLAPSQPGPDPVPVSAASYLAPELVAASEDYRGELRLLVLAAIVVELALLALLAAGRPRRLWAALGRLESRRPRLAALAAGATIAAVVAAGGLPLGLWVHELRVDVGLSTQGVGGWLDDRARAAAIAIALAAAGGLLLLALQRRLPRRWWLAGAGIAAAFALAISFVGPLLLAPIFNDFERLPPGPLRADLLELAEEAGVEVDDVYRIDASRRGTTLNAYVDGVGASRRVVLYDNLIDAADRDALRWVVAHELGHVEARDIPRGILFVAIVALPGMLLVREVGGAVAARRGTTPGTTGALPAYALALSVATLGLGLAGNQLSRAVEERADRFALELTDDPDGMIALQTTVARRNLSDPDPPAWWQGLLATHPDKLERLGLAEAYRQRERESGPG